MAGKLMLHPESSANISDMGYTHIWQICHEKKSVKCLENVTCDRKSK